MPIQIAPRFRRSPDWTPTMPSRPGSLRCQGEGHWVNVSHAFNNPIVPVGWDGHHVRLGRAKPWECPRAVLRHRGCGGVVGTVLNLGPITVLGVLDPDRLYRRLEVVSLTRPRPFPQALAAATEIIGHGTCHRCHTEIPIRPGRRHLRSLPTSPTRKTKTITV